MHLQQRMVHVDLHLQGRLHGIQRACEATVDGLRDPRRHIAATPQVDIPSKQDVSSEKKRCSMNFSACPRSSSLCF